MKRIVRAARHAGLVLGCLTGAAAPAHAAQWSIAPSVTWGADSDSNRLLEAQGRTTQSASLGASLQLQRSTETTQFSLSPHVDWQDYFTRTLGNLFERDVTAAGDWTRESGRVDFTAEDADQSTVTTEATQTGILSSSLHQRTDAATVSSTFDQSERRALILQLSYSDISYYGLPAAQLIDLLSGYRYPSGSLAERFSLSQRSTLTASAFSSELLTRLSGGNTNETGVQLDFTRMLSERTQLDVSAGGVRMRTSTGGRTLPLASLQLSHDWELGNVALSYSRTLTPYGTGVLVQRQQWELSATRNLSERLDVTMSLLRVQNSQPRGQPVFGTQIALIPTYDSVTAGCDWQLAESWKVSGQAGAAWTRTVEGVSEPVHEWRVGLSLTWTPHALAESVWP